MDHDFTYWKFETVLGFIFRIQQLIKIKFQWNKQESDEMKTSQKQTQKWLLFRPSTSERGDFFYSNALTHTIPTF